MSRAKKAGAVPPSRQLAAGRGDRETDCGAPSPGDHRYDAAKAVRNLVLSPLRVFQHTIGRHNAMLFTEQYGGLNSDFLGGDQIGRLGPDGVSLPLVLQLQENVDKPRFGRIRLWWYSAAVVSDFNRNGRADKSELWHGVMITLPPAKELWKTYGDSRPLAAPYAGGGPPCAAHALPRRPALP